MNQLGSMSARDRMIHHQLVARGITDQRVLDAMRAIPREQFVLPEERAAAYDDCAMSIGYGQTISQPYIVGLMSERLRPEPGLRVLEIGTGSGYQTAVLSKLGLETYTIERIKPLLDETFDRLLALGIRNVHFRYGDGLRGWPENAPFDRILIAAGAPEVPNDLLRGQLRDGGLAVLPVGPHEGQTLVQIHREGNNLVRSDICPVRFVKLIGKGAWEDQ